MSLQLDACGYSSALMMTQQAAVCNVATDDNLRLGRLFHKIALTAGRTLPLLAVFLPEQCLVTVAPVNHRVDNREQRLSHRRDGILRTRRQLWEDGLRHKTVFNKLL